MSRTQFPLLLHWRLHPTPEEKQTTENKNKKNSNQENAEMGVGIASETLKWQVGSCRLELCNSALFCFGIVGVGCYLLAVNHKIGDSKPPSNA